MLRRTERAIIRAMRLMKRKGSFLRRKMRGIFEEIRWLAKANGIRWYGHALMKKDILFRSSWIILKKENLELKVCGESKVNEGMTKIWS